MAAGNSGHLAAAPATPSHLDSLRDAKSPLTMPRPPPTDRIPASTPAGRPAAQPQAAGHRPRAPATRNSRKQRRLSQPCPRLPRARHPWPPRRKLRSAGASAPLPATTLERSSARRAPLPPKPPSSPPRRLRQPPPSPWELPAPRRRAPPSATPPPAGAAPRPLASQEGRQGPAAADAGRPLPGGAPWRR